MGSVSVTNNAAKYLVQADRINHGLDPGLIFGGLSARGPVFPLLIALSFRIFGASVGSAFLVVRVAFAVGIILTYLLGRVLYGNAAGLIAALLVSSSYGINLAAGYIDTDIVLPALILLFLLLYHHRLWLAAGICLGLAILVKESAAVFIAIPLLMPLFLGRRWRHSIHALLGLMLIVLPWAIWISITHGSALATLGVMHPEIQRQAAALRGDSGPVGYWARLLTLNAPGVLTRYYQEHLKRATAIAPIIALSWLLILGRAWAKRGNDLILALSALCFLPVALHVANAGVRLGQTTVLFFLSYIAVAGALTRGRRVIGVCVAIVLIAVQLAAVDMPRILANRARAVVSGLQVGHRVLQVGGRFTSDQKLAASWLESNADGAGILADGYSSEALVFFTGYDVQEFHPVDEYVLSDLQPLQGHGRLLYLFTYSNFRSGAPQHRVLYPIFQDRLLRDLGDARYLVISGRGLFLGEYLDKVPWAELAFGNATTRVYSLGTPLVPVGDWELCVNEAFWDDLEWLRPHAVEYDAMVGLLGGLGAFPGACKIKHGESY